MPAQLSTAEAYIGWELTSHGPHGLRGAASQRNGPGLGLGSIFGLVPISSLGGLLQQRLQPRGMIPSCRRLEVTRSLTRGICQSFPAKAVGGNGRKTSSRRSAYTSTSRRWASRARLFSPSSLATTEAFPRRDIRRRAAVTASKPAAFAPDTGSFRSPSDWLPPACAAAHASRPAGAWTGSHRRAVFSWFVRSGSSGRYGIPRVVAHIVSLDRCQ